MPLIESPTSSIFFSDFEVIELVDLCFVGGQGDGDAAWVETEGSLMCGEGDDTLGGQKDVVEHLSDSLILGCSGDTVFDFDTEIAK